MRNFTIVDARSYGRFMAVDKEPRPHLRSGSIPHSLNLPYQEVLDGKKFKSSGALKVLFDNKFANEPRLVFSCGSGMTACIILLAGQIAGITDKVLYDCSWTEWAELNGLILGK